MVRRPSFWHDVVSPVTEGLRGAVVEGTIRVLT
jgi:hypothetical protein